MGFTAKRSYLKRMISSSDVACYNLLRMHRSTFDKLCSMLTDVGGLKPCKNMLVDEQVAMFLHILAHHVKNRVIQHNFGRSGETISRYFNSVLTSMMRLGDMLLKKPEPVPEDSNDERWEGSAADGRVLRDAISRRNGLRVPQGYYYLVDAGYTNCVDPLENEVQEMGVDVDGMENTPIQNMDASDEWATFRDTLANEMFTAFASNRTFR
ncbi:uncharacterized protein LOC129319784 [Prosopis cineraria]|uniref:uncharacterized protein LOC129319784 n=1 Tax=Prosopis cineraria TaxID=364024 RepID=UPI00240F5100|nr:uncharacterized protein LOC129319784 [Prosopis cineraria]